MTFAWYQDWAGREPGRAALVAADEIVSYGDLHRRIVERADVLRRAGVSPGDRLVLGVAPDSIEGVIALLATLSLTAQAVVPDFDWEQRDFAVNLAAFSGCPRLEKDAAGALYVQPGRCDQPPWPGAEGGGVWLFTSGTTSRPQPWFRSLSLLADNVERVRVRLPKELLQSRPNGLCLLPLYHGYGLINALFLLHAIGGCVHMADGSAPGAVVDAIHRNRIKILYAWPVQFAALANAELWRARPAAVLRWCVSSSYKLDPAVTGGFEFV